MENIEKIVRQLVLLPNETEWVEFKVDNHNPQEIGEYISALSNSASYLKREKSYIIYGVDDSNHNFIGTSFNPKKQKKGNQEIENWIATQLSPPVDFKIHQLIINDKKIVVFEIDAAKSVPIKFRGVEYIRVGSYKQPLSKFPEKARKIWTKDLETDFEKRIALSSLKGTEVLKLIDYPAVFELLNIDLPDNREGILSKLESERLIVNRISNYEITNLGAILFAKNLEDFDNLNKRTIRIIFYKGKGRLETIKEYEGKKGYAIEFESLIDYIVDRLPSNEIIEKALRKEVKMYPTITIRELIAKEIVA